MRKFISIACLLLLPGLSLSQTIISFSTGYGSFSMSDMKTVQREMVSVLPPGTQATSSFPSFYTYELGFATTIPKSNLFAGISFGYGSTGGRVAYSDYSGAIRSDQLVSYRSLQFSFGFFSESRNKKWRLQGDLKPGIFSNVVKLQATETIGNDSSEDDARFTGINIAVQPTLTFTRYVGHFGVNVYAGFHLSLLQSKMKTSDGAYLFANNGEAHVDWTGFRAGVGLSYFVGHWLQDQK